MVFNAIEEQTIHWLKEKKDKRTCNNKTLHKLKIKIYGEDLEGTLYIKYLGDWFVTSFHNVKQFSIFLKFHGWRVLVFDFAL
jgi:hypothetical protein